MRAFLVTFKEPPFYDSRDSLLVVAVDFADAYALAVKRCENNTMRKLVGIKDMGIDEVSVSRKILGMP